MNSTDHSANAAQELVDHIAAKPNTFTIASLAEVIREHCEKPAVADCQARITELENQTYSVHSCSDNCQRLGCIQRRKIADLQANFLKYGNHLQTCKFYWQQECDCGYTALEKQLKEAKVTT